MNPSGRPRVVVCGTGFGRIYLAGLAAAGARFELAGVVARGSARSRACARHYRVPLYESVDALPDAVDVACVVVGSAPTGGVGAQLAVRLLDRGIHVLQEHPLHSAELSECLRAARRNGVQYRVNSHHVHVAPVRGFIEAARALLAEQPPLFVDAVTSFQVLYTLYDILVAALGRSRPWGFEPPAAAPRRRGLGWSERPFQSLDGVLAGVPFTLRVQNQVDPAAPDNYAHLWHRVVLGVEGGTLSLLGSAGPMLWCPRPHLPASAAGAPAFDALADTHLDYPSATPLGAATAASWRQMLVELWPQAVVTALTELWQAAVEGADPMVDGQRHLALCQLTADTTAALGPVELVSRTAPRVLSLPAFLPGPVEELR